MPLQGKTAVVTGAAGTLGLAVARALLEQNAHVALVDHDAMRLDSLVRFLRGPVMALASDVTDPSAVREAVARIEASAGAIDILVNAASTPSAERSETLSELEWRRVLGRPRLGPRYRGRGRGGGTPWRHLVAQSSAPFAGALVLLGQF